jgi:hypothetical protein
LRDEIAGTLDRPAAFAALGLPPGWSSEPSAEGGWLLFRDRSARRAAARVAWMVTLGLGLLAAWTNARPLLSGGSNADLASALVAGLALVGLALGSAWLSQGGSVWRVRSGWIEMRGWYLGHRWSREFPAPRLSVTRRTDSDGDHWFELIVAAGSGRKVVDRAMNTSDEVLGLARWLESHAGAPLEIDRGVEPPAGAAGAGLIAGP